MLNKKAIASIIKPVAAAATKRGGEIKLKITDDLYKITFSAASGQQRSSEISATDPRRTSAIRGQVIADLGLAAQKQFKHKMPPCKIGVIGDTNHQKTTLTAAIVSEVAGGKHSAYAIAKALIEENLGRGAEQDSPSRTDPACKPADKKLNR